MVLSLIDFISSTMYVMIETKLEFPLHVHAQSLSPVQLFSDPMGYSPPGSSVLWISQARILKWVAISSSSLLHWQADALSLSHQGRPILGYFLK